MKTNSINLDITNFIPVGHRNAVSRKYLVSATGLSDREVRRAIEMSESPIINLGRGYFIPDERDEVDCSEAAAYVAQERARIRAIEEKIQTKFRAYEHVNEQMELEL
jgi:hypothetical protein